MPFGLELGAGPGGGGPATGRGDQGAQAHAVPAGLGVPSEPSCALIINCGWNSNYCCCN